MISTVEFCRSAFGLPVCNLVRCGRSDRSEAGGEGGRVDDERETGKDGGRRLGTLLRCGHSDRSEVSGDGGSVEEERETLRDAGALLSLEALAELALALLLGDELGTERLLCPETPEGAVIFLSELRPNFGEGARSGVVSDEERCDGSGDRPGSGDPDGEEGRAPPPPVGAWPSFSGFLSTLVSLLSCAALESLELRLLNI